MYSFQYYSGRTGFELKTRAQTPLLKSAEISSRIKMLYLTLFLLEQCDKVGKFLLLDNEPEERETA